jgi:hypothetical protein
MNAIAQQIFEIENRPVKLCGCGKRYELIRTMLHIRGFAGLMPRPPSIHQLLELGSIAGKPFGQLNDLGHLFRVIDAVEGDQQANYLVGFGDRHIAPRRAETGVSARHEVV